MGTEEPVVNGRFLATPFSNFKHLIPTVRQ
jgi:hypothetical protein